jgi:hypothetical protein
MRTLLLLLTSKQALKESLFVTFNSPNPQVKSNPSAQRSGGRVTSQLVWHEHSVVAQDHCSQEVQQDKLVSTSWEGPKAT